MGYRSFFTVALACVPSLQVTAAETTEWELWLPSNSMPVKAVFVAPRWGDGANMVRLIQKNLSEKLGIATMLTREDKMTFKEDHFFTSIPNTLSSSAVALKRPELAHAPLLLWSHSNAAAYVQRCLKEIPERVVAYCLFKSAYGHNNDLGTMSRAATQAFGQSIWDMNDHITRDYNQDHERRVMLDNVAAARKQGALVHVTLVRGTHHLIDGQERLMLAFFETAMAMRVPRNADPARGPVKLIGGLEEGGLVQDRSSKSVCAYSDYPAGKNRRGGWWLPTREYAVMWNEYALNARGAVVAPGKRASEHASESRERNTDGLSSEDSKIEITPEAVAKWDARLRAQVMKAIKAGRKPRFHSEKANMEVMVKEVGANGDLRVSTRAGMQFGVKWSRLTLSNKGKLATTTAGDDARGHAIAAFYLLAQGKDSEVATHLRQAGDAADEVRLYSRGPSAEEAKSGRGRAPAPRAPRKAEAGPPGRAKRTTPWDVAALSKPPKIHPATERPANGMRSFFYEGADYKGKLTWVFAYYAAPKGAPPAGGWPAVVCAHGGGGTAYPDWVRYWNNRGYAAISMDLEGHLPGGRFFGVEGNFPTDVGHANAGPRRIDWFGDRDLPDTEQWFYHAVADVIRANSLLRSFPEINRNRIGLTGISWGGVIVCSVAGVDPRFAFVVPVYGAAFIHESDNPGLAQWFPPKNMTQKQFQDYRTKWDGAAHLPHAKMPMLFVTSIKDPVFQIDIFARSAEAAGGPSAMCLRPWMIHGHGNGWNDPVEIAAFADSILKGGPALPKLERPEIKPDTGIVHTKFAGRDITEAWIYVTTSRGTWQARNWHFIQCRIGDRELVSHQRLPQGATAFFVYVFKDVNGQRSNHAASELVIPGGKL